jgi:hypothetical protein
LYFSTVGGRCPFDLHRCALQSIRRLPRSARNCQEPNPRKHNGSCGPEEGKNSGWIRSSRRVPRGLPLREEFVDFGLAIEIEPEKHGACVPVGLSEGAIGEKQSAIPPGDASNAALVVSSIEGEAKRVDVVGCGFVDVSRGDLRDRCGERHSVVGGILVQGRTMG